MRAAESPPGAVVSACATRLEYIMTKPDDLTTTNASSGDTLGWDGPPAMRDLTDQTLGDYHVERLIGKGGMGEVYLARQLSLNRHVALKVLRPELTSNKTYLSRFETEATAVAKLNHPNIVHIYQLGLADNVRFIAMEYVHGTNLKDYLHKKGALDFPLALSIMRQAALAIGAAGEIGLIHRDIKPENLLLTRKGQVKVADFGLCRDQDADAINLTQPGVTMGTPAYMSPEQAQGYPLDHRSDLYSLGVTFYHMLTGVPPFRGDTPMALALKHVKDVPARLSVHRPDIPPALDTLVLKLLAKAREDRYQTSAELLRDLTKIREAMHAPSGLQPMSDVAGSSVSTTAIAPTPAAPPSAGKARTSAAPFRLFRGEDDLAYWPGRGVWLTLIALAVLLGGAAGWAKRPADLLSAGLPPSKGPPGLWMAPLWEKVPRASSPEEQYRHAQLLAPAESREEAWLAVPGHWPSARDWSSRAYTQLARLVLRRQDEDLVAAFAEELDHWNHAQTHEKELVEILRAGVKALEGDLDGVLEAINTKVKPHTLTDLALMELTLAVTVEAERAASRPGAPGSPALALQGLRTIRQSLMQRLFQSESLESLVRPKAG